MSVPPETLALQQQRRIPPPKTLMLVFGLALFFWLLVVTSWVYEDAYISFRTLDCFWHGYGLRWNQVERVQSFTHPLWLLLLLPIYGVTREAFLTIHAVSLTVSMLAIGLFLRFVCRTTAQRLAAICFLIFSRAFIDYSSSGLENPLAHLLAVLFVLSHFKPERNPVRLFLLAFTGALLATTRMDLALLTVPSILSAWWPLRSSKRALAVLILGGLPFLAWEAFAIVYYGFPAPNTAYAKLVLETDAVTLARQGIDYFVYLFKYDTSSFLLIALALPATLSPSARRNLPLSLGIYLYLAYVVKVGADYCGGRFFSAPVLMAAAILVRQAWMERLYVLLPACIIVAALALVQRNAPVASLWSVPKIGVSLNMHVFDQRTESWAGSTLLAWRKGRTLPMEQGTIEGLGFRRSWPPRKPLALYCVGEAGFFTGTGIHVMDALGLGEPYLAHLPGYVNPKAPPGHYVRVSPPGYQESILSDTIRIENRRLAAYYRAIRAITRDPLFSPHRWKEILKLNLGLYHDLTLDYSFENHAIDIADTIAAGHAVDAEKLLWANVERAPWLDRPFELLKDLHAKAGTLEQCADRCAAVSKDDTRHVPLFYQAQCLELAGHAEETQQIYLKVLPAALKEPPLFVNEKVLQALQEIAIKPLNDRALAEGIADLLMKIAPDNWRTWRCRAEFLRAYAADERCEIIQAYQKASDYAPDPFLNCQRLAGFLAETGNVQDMVSAFAALAALRPECAAYQHYLGVAHDLAGEAESARAAQETAWTLCKNDYHCFGAPLSKDLLFSLVEAYRREHNWDNAERLLETYKHVEPDDWRVWLAEAHLFNDQNDPERSLQSYLAALAHNGFAPGVFDEILGLFLPSMGADHLIAPFQQLTRALPDSYIAHFDFGVVLDYAQRDLEAAREYRRAYALNPQAPGTAYCLEDLYRKIGDKALTAARRCDAPVACLDEIRTFLAVLADAPSESMADKVLREFAACAKELGLTEMVIGPLGEFAAIQTSPSAAYEVLGDLLAGLNGAVK
jgi:arabinofuranosyltransferase